MGIEIKDKVALVTGANRGIGKSIVDTFLKHGAKKVYLAVRNPESTTELHNTYGDKVVTLKADMSDKDTISALAESATDVDIVVNNAGVLYAENPLSANAEETLTAELNTNLFGLLRIAQAFAPILEKQQGALVQLNSVASLKNFADISTYSASKAATYSLTQGLREKLGEKGVQVLSVHPGPIDTDMLAGTGFEGESTTVVSEGIVSALKDGEFHLFPDTLAQQFFGGYKGFSDAFITGNPFAE